MPIKLLRLEQYRYTRGCRVSPAKWTREPFNRLPSRLCPLPTYKRLDIKPRSNFVAFSGTRHYFSLAQRTDIYCPYIYNRIRLSVGLGHALQLVLLLDGVAVGASLGRVDQFVREALRDGLDVAEGGLPRPGAEQPDGLKEGSIIIVGEHALIVGKRVKIEWNRNRQAHESRVQSVFS